LEGSWQRQAEQVKLFEKSIGAALEDLMG